MIENKDVQMSPASHAECVFDSNYVLVIDSKILVKGLFDYPPELKQLKQQILQDHEEAKKWRAYEKSTPKVKFMPTPNEPEPDTAQPNSSKDRQIVKRLEERIKIKKEERRVHTRCFMVHDIDIFLQKILEGE